MKTRITIACLLMLPVCLSAQKLYKITDFGAVPDKTTLSTKAVQQAIDQCAQEGGGQVLVPAGTFIIGSIFLKTGVTLFLDAAAVLKGSPNYSDYYWPDGSKKNKGLICAVGQTNISIRGTGIIDGNGGHHNYYSPEPKNGKENRPNAFYLYRSTNIKLKEFTLKNGARWDVMVHDCDLVTVDDIKVLSRIVANNDGLDLTDCHNVTVSNSYFDCGDDGICLKSEGRRGVKNVTITNCIVKSESNGIKFGTASVGGFEDITISNCVVYDTRLSGLALELVDGGSLNRVVINNITMHRVNGSIFLKLGHRKGETPGSFKNVMISNIVADGIGHWSADTTAPYYKAAFDPRIGVVIAGQPGYEIENLTLSNIRLEFAGGGKKEDAARLLKDNPATYPEYTNFGITPAYGINCRYVKNLSLQHISMEAVLEDARPALWLEEVQGVEVDAIQAKVSPAAQSYMHCKNVKDVALRHCSASGVDIPFVALSGSYKGITIMNNDFKALSNICTPTDADNKELFLSGNRTK